MSRRLLAIWEECEDRGVRLSAKDGGVEARGPSTRGLREELRRHKPNVLYYLRTGNCHHGLEPAACNVCNGTVRRLIEERATV